MAAMGHFRRFEVTASESGLPPTADISLRRSVLTRWANSGVTRPQQTANTRLPRQTNKHIQSIEHGFSVRPSTHVFSSVSLFDLKARFFIPTRSSAKPSRAGAVKVGRRTNLSTCFALARPYLDSFEHDGTLGAVGMTIRGELAFGRGSIAPQPCIR
jgi:hypothetical protein